MLSYTTTSSGDVYLSDGRQVNLFGGSGNFGSSTQFTINPTTTTSYSIANYTGACAEGATYQNRAATVRVQPGLRIDSLSAREICAGQPVTLYYTASPGYTLPDRVSVRGVDYFASVATLVRPGQLVFTPPISLTPAPCQQFQVRHDLADTLIAQASLPLLIRNRPLAYWTINERAVGNPAQTSLEARVTAGGTTTLVLDTGERFTAQAGVSQGFSRDYTSLVYLPVYVAKTTAYSIVSAINECGTASPNSFGGPLTVRITGNTPPPTGLTILSSAVNTFNFCPGSPQRINLFPTGTFNTDNQFQLEVSNANGTFSVAPVQSFSSVASLSFLLPGLPGTYRVRVSSTSPITRSNEEFFTVSRAPVASVFISLPGGNSGSLTTVAGQAISVSYNLSDGRSPYQYELANGPKGRADFGFSTTYQPTVTTNYGIVRVTDACGVTATVNNSASIVTVLPSLLRTGAINASQVCIQAPVLVPYVQLGSVPVSASYVVQFSEDQATWTAVPTSGTVSPLTVTLPASMANKQVFYRVAYLANGELFPGIRAAERVQIRTTPNTVLSAPNNATSVQVDVFNSFSAQIRLIDLTSESSVIVSNGTTVLRLFTSASGSNHSISQPGTYSIVSAANGCGYGTASGTVRATLKPYLSLQRTSQTSFCLGQTGSFSYAAAGDFAANNKFLIYLSGSNGGPQVRTLLTESSALNGVVSFSLSPAMGSGTYSIWVESSAPLGTYSGASFIVDTPASATLTSGSIVVYEREARELFVSSNNAGVYSYTLATPTGLSVLAGSAPKTYLPFSFSGFTQSGSYSLVSASNECGVGQVSGALSVTVLPPSSVKIGFFEPYFPTYCTDGRYVVYLNTTGVFNANNVFTAYLTDSKGGLVRTLPTVSSPTQLTITIPADLPASDAYLLRIGSSSPQHLGSSQTKTYLFRQSPTGMLSGNTSLFKGDSARISVALTGTPPWQFVMTDFFGPRTFTTSTTPYSLTVKPDTTVGFRLTEVRDSQCGVGTATGTALITVTKLLATEPALPLQVRTWPNPTAGTLLIEGDVPGRGDVAVSLHNTAGALVHQSIASVSQGQVRTRLDVSNLAAGVYILTTEQEGRRSQFKVLKE